MSRCKLPVERCEQIVDLCNFPHREFVNKPATRRPSTYATLRACALTCKAWYPRSRLNLLRIVELSTERQVDLLIRTLTAQPFLADLVIELEHYRPPGSLNNYVPLSRSPLPQILQNCRSLVFPLLKSHHITYTRSLPFFAHITRLEIAIDGHTISTLLHLIWSFPDIQHLLLKWSYSREYSTAVSEIYRRKLGEMRPPSCCKYLEYLNLRGMPTGMLPPTVFGYSVTHLEIQSQVDDSHTEADRWAFVASLPLLQSISLSFLCSIELDEPNEVKEWLKFSISHAILASVRAFTAFRSFELAPRTNMVRPFHDTPGVPEANPGREVCYCAVTRLDTLDRLFARAHLTDILERFPRLEVFHLTLFDAQEKESWWMDELGKRMRGFSQVLRLHVTRPFETDDEFEFCGWREDVPSSTTASVQSQEEMGGGDQSGDKGDDPTDVPI